MTLDTGQSLALKYTIMNFQVAWKVKNVLSCSATVSFSRSIPRWICLLRFVSFIAIAFYFYFIFVRQKSNPLKFGGFAVCATGVCITTICILPSQYVCVFRATLPIQQSCYGTTLIGWPL